MRRMKIVSQSEYPRELPRINPRREALVQACRAIANWQGQLRLSYSTLPEFQEIDNQYQEVYQGLVKEILAIDKEEEKAYHDHHIRGLHEAPTNQPT